MTKPLIVSSSNRKLAAERAERFSSGFRALVARGVAVHAAAAKKTKTIETEEITEEECAELLRKLRKKAAKKAAAQSAVRPSGSKLAVVVPYVPVDYAALEARVERAKIAQAERSARSAASLDRAEYQARTERKLSLVPGSIHRQQKSDRKSAEHTDLKAAVFDGILPSVLRALRMGGLSDVQIAAIVLAQKCG